MYRILKLLDWGLFLQSQICTWLADGAARAGESKNSQFVKQGENVNKALKKASLFVRMLGAVAEAGTAAGATRTSQAEITREEN